MKLNKEEIEDFCSYLEDKGYKKYPGHYKNEDYGYWKGFQPYKDESGETERRYQIAILVYDFSKYPSYEGEKPIGLQFEYIGHQEEYLDRMDFSVSDDKITIEEFEDLADHFYHKVFDCYVKNKFNKIDKEE